MTDRRWILRNRIVWHKPNAIPSSVKDRFSIDYEFVYFFVKARRYYFDRQRERSLCPGSKHVNKRPGSKGELIKRTVIRGMKKRRKTNEAFLEPANRRRVVGAGRGSRPRRSCRL